MDVRSLTCGAAAYMVAFLSDWLNAQMDGFASDSVRMIGSLRKDAQQHVQILLFSATFNEKVKNYALRVVRDNGREEANQVSFLLHLALVMQMFLKVQLHFPEKSWGWMRETIHLP